MDAIPPGCSTSSPIPDLMGAALSWHPSAPSACSMPGARGGVGKRPPGCHSGWERRGSCVPVGGFQSAPRACLCAHVWLCSVLHPKGR